MLKLQAVASIKRQVDEKPVVKRWKYKRHSFPNKKSSYWIKWKIHPDDVKFYVSGRSMMIDFDKELTLDNPNTQPLNEWKVSRSSYYQHLPFIVEELNFFETMYDNDNELIAGLFRLKYLIDVNRLDYTEKNYDAFVDVAYKTLFTDSMKAKIIKMIDDNYVDDIEEENPNLSSDILTIMQRKKKSLEFKNDHVKAMLMISFGIKILAIIASHYITSKELHTNPKIDTAAIFYAFYIPMFKVFDFEFNIYNKIYSYVENKVNSAYNFNKSIFEQQEIECRRARN
jgi:hypothetical protein